MDCFQDFCLACDKQCEGSYCSQTCRLADFEKATSTPPSPLTPTFGQTSRSTSATSVQTGYMLPPAYSFEQREASMSAAYHSGSTHSSSRSADLSSESSRSNASYNDMSKQTQQELDSYFSAFAKKVSRRRSSLR